MQNLYDKARSDGITVPIFHNDKGRNGIWVPASSDVPGTVTGPNDLYAFDGYPGGTCCSNATPRLALGRARLGDLGPGRRQGRLQRLAEHARIRRRVRRRLVRLLGQPGHLRLHGAARGPRLRARVL